MNLSELPQTQIEAIRYFADTDKCHEFLVEMRWPEGVVCPHCESKNVGNVSTGKRRVWNCKNCKKQFTAKVKTIFEASPLGLDKWLPAVWLIVNAKNGISSCELARALGVTQKTAWHMGHRIRAAMHSGNFSLSGEVEADETFIGAKARNMHTNKKGEVSSRRQFAKTVVLGLLERTSEKSNSKVKLKVVKTTRRAELMPHILKNVEHGSAVFTDALQSYSGLEHAYTHAVIDHAKSYAEGNVHTNGLENFWSLLKRSIRGTYICPAPFHLFRYLDEQATRFNERKVDDSTRFVNSMQRVSNRRLTYKKLTGKEENLS
jgi:transposase-like protein